MKRIKRGVALFERVADGQYFIGTRKRAATLTTPAERVIAREMIRGASEDQLLGNSDARPIEIQNTLAELAHHHLLDTKQSTLRLSKRFISKVDHRARKNSRPESDAAFAQLQRRVAPELTQITWIAGVHDAGIEVLSARQNYLVEISGSDRVATLLYPILLSSGLSHARFTPNSRGRQVHIGDLDIAVSGFKASEIGFSFAKECEDRRRDYSLFPIDRDENYLDEISTPDLKVHCGEIDPEQLSLWMSSGQPFLHIPAPLADRGQVGPLVIPGKTPCLRCAQLLEEEHTGISYSQPLRFESEDFPQVAAHFIAALAASQILRFCDWQTMYGALTAESDSKKYQEKLVGDEITGKIISIDYQFLEVPEVVAITRHPLCGCAF